MTQLSLAVFCRPGSFALESLRFFPQSRPSAPVTGVLSRLRVVHTIVDVLCSTRTVAVLRALLCPVVSHNFHHSSRTQHLVESTSKPFLEPFLRMASCNSGLFQHARLFGRVAGKSSICLSCLSLTSTVLCPSAASVLRSHLEDSWIMCRTFSSINMSLISRCRSHLASRL